MVLRRVLSGRADLMVRPHQMDGYTPKGELRTASNLIGEQDDSYLLQSASVARYLASCSVAVT